MKLEKTINLLKNFIINYKIKFKKKSILMSLFFISIINSEAQIYGNIDIDKFIEDEMNNKTKVQNSTIKKEISTNKNINIDDYLKDIPMEYVGVTDKKNNENSKNSKNKKRNKENIKKVSKDTEKVTKKKNFFDSLIHNIFKNNKKDNEKVEQKDTKLTNDKQVYINSKNEKINISDHELDVLADKIYQNEASGKKEKLLHWNDGEDFPSLGIGHFIWFRKNGENYYGESFPSLIKFYKERGIKLPKLIEENEHSPWENKKELEEKKLIGDPDTLELIDFLEATKKIQILYIYERLEKAIEKMVAVAENKENVKNQFYRMVNTKNGIYPLIDYVNFKGEGTKKTEAYNNTSWGLLQVLENMKGTETGTSALVEFSDSAKKVLENRVKNAPKWKNEKKWLVGWFKRLDTYKDFEIR